MRSALLVTHTGRPDMVDRAKHTAALLLDERLTALGVVGIVLVVAAIAGSAREKHPTGAGPVADPDPGRPRVTGFRDGR